jgi:hypothetical protein
MSVSGLLEYLETVLPPGHPVSLEEVGACLRSGPPFVRVRPGIYDVRQPAPADRETAQTR